MLRDRQGADGTIEGPSGASDELLIGEDLQVHNPDARHFVHSDEGSLESVVESVELGVIDGEVADDFHALAKVSMPQFVATGKSFQSALVKDEALAQGGVTASQDVAPP